MNRDTNGGGSVSPREGRDGSVPPGPRGRGVEAGAGRGGSGARRERIRHTLGWAYWPLFVWRPVPPVVPGGPGVILSIVHTGYALSAAAVAAGLALWLGWHLEYAPYFLAIQLLWISGLISLLLLNSGFLEHLDGRPLRRLGWANVLSLVRVSFLPLLLYLLWRREWSAGLAIYAFLGLTDVADGVAARRLGEESKLGFVLDPFGDILFHLGVLLALVLSGVLSWLTGGLVIARYLLLLAGCGVLYLTKGEIWIQPTPFGKATGLAIAVLTAVALLLLGFGWGGRVAYLWIDRGLSFFFGAGLVHVMLIGRINFRRPAVGGTAVYRRGWGLLVGHRAAAGARPEGSGAPGAAIGPQQTPPDQDGTAGS